MPTKATARPVGLFRFSEGCPNVVLHLLDGGDHGLIDREQGLFNVFLSILPLVMDILWYQTTASGCVAA